MVTMSTKDILGNDIELYYHELVCDGRLIGYHLESGRLLGYRLEFNRIIKVNSDVVYRDKFFALDFSLGNVSFGSMTRVVEQEFKDFDLLNGEPILGVLNQGIYDFNDSIYGFCPVEVPDISDMLKCMRWVKKHILDVKTLFAQIKVNLDQNYSFDSRLLIGAKSDDIKFYLIPNTYKVGMISNVDRDKVKYAILKHLKNKFNIEYDNNGNIIIF